MMIVANGDLSEVERSSIDDKERFRILLLDGFLESTDRFCIGHIVGKTWLTSSPSTVMSRPDSHE
jgi:hypothetical protein